MMSMRMLRTLAASHSLEKFRQQIGPFALIQRPEEELSDTDKMGIPAGSAHTMMAKAEDISAHSLALLFEFEDLIVAALPPLKGVDALTIGRQPDCELVLDDPSVSKRHAVLRWNQKKHRCTLLDLGSTNGTFLNASVRVRRETELRDGDIISFGDSHFWFLLTETLHTRLAQLKGSGRMRSFSG